MIVLFHENVLLLSTYKFIVIAIKYRNFGMCVYDSSEKQMLNTISLVNEQRKNEFDKIAEVRFAPSIFVHCEGDLTLFFFVFFKEHLQLLLCTKK